MNIIEYFAIVLAFTMTVLVYSAESQEKKPLNPLQTALSAAAGALADTVLTRPLGNLFNWSVVDGKVPWKQITTTPGVLWDGGTAHFATMYANTWYQMAANAIVKRSGMRDELSAPLAGALSFVVATPGERLVLELQYKDRWKEKGFNKVNLLNVARWIVSQGGGMRELYKGSAAIGAREALWGAGYLAVFPKAKKFAEVYISQDMPCAGLARSSFAACAAGIPLAYGSQPVAALATHILAGKGKNMREVMKALTAEQSAMVYAAYKNLIPKFGVGSCCYYHPLLGLMILKQVCASLYKGAVPRTASYVVGLGVLADATECVNEKLRSLGA